MHDVVDVLLGAGLVTIGVLAAALADRIRGLRVARETGARVHAARAHARPDVLAVGEAAELLHSEPAATTPTRVSRAESRSHSAKPTIDGASHVIAALVGAGYRKAIATESTWACSAAERTKIEDWTRAALRRCSRGGVS